MSEPIRKELEDWEKSIASNKGNAYEQLLDDLIVNVFKEVDSTMFTNIDNLLFHTHAYLQGSNIQNDAREKILRMGHLFDPDIHTIQDLHTLNIDQLSYMAKQHLSKANLFSFVQGCFTGTGRFLLYGIDVPVLVLANIRNVQLIALTFGHELNQPYEMMIALKVFHAATLPKKSQKQAWDRLLEDVHAMTIYMYEGDENITEPLSFHPMIRLVFKNIVMIMARKRKIRGFPLVSAGVGAFMNYQFTKHVGTFALRFYQKRYVIEHN